MVLIPQCDNCNKIFDGGFNGQLKKVVSQKAKTDFVVDIKIRPPHLCGNCFTKIMKEALRKNG